MPTKLTGPDNRLNRDTVILTRNRLSNGKFSESIRVPPPFHWELPSGSSNRVSEDGRVFHRTTETPKGTVFDGWDRLDKYFFKWLRID